MATSKSSGKLILFIIVAVIGGAAGFGYFQQAAKLSDSTKTAEKEVLPPDAQLLKPKPNDIILGDINAIVTMVEYSSLSCPHCAHFHESILPTIEKDFITPGKVKVVVRHFPTNEPALKAAQVVECAGKNGLNRPDFMKVLFSMQAQWALGEDFIKNLKQIALVGGMDSATFDSCINDKDLETAILASRQEADTQLKVTATPSFFINGMKYEGDVSVEGLTAKLEEAGSGPQK